MMPRHSLSPWFLVIALLVAACGGTGDDVGSQGNDPEASGTSELADADPPRSTSTSAPTDVPQAAVEALDFTAQTVDGGSIDGTTFAGGDVVLWMWAPW